MPSAMRAPMDLLRRPDRSFEVLLYTLPGTRYGLQDRWFCAGPFAARLDAQEEFEQLCREFREDALVVLVLLTSVHDEATGLYRDRILEARGRAPLIRRERMTTLSLQERKRLQTATVPARRVAQPPAPARPPRPGATLGNPAAWGTAAVVALLFVWALLAAAPD